MDLKTRTNVKLRYLMRVLLKILESSSIPGMYMAILFMSLGVKRAGHGLMFN